MIGRQLFRIFLLGLVLFGLAFVSAPWFALRALQAGARDGDVAALAELVDFRAVRASLRGQVPPPEPPPRPQADGPAPDIWRDPIGAARRALEPLVEPLAPLAEPLIAPPRLEPYLTPEGLHDLTRGYAPGTAPAEPPPEGLTGRVRASLAAPLPGLRYWGANRARFSVHPPGRPEEVTVLTFQRTGLFRWRLTHLNLPERDGG